MRFRSFFSFLLTGVRRVAALSGGVERTLSSGGIRSALLGKMLGNKPSFFRQNRCGKVRFPDRLVPEQDNSVTVNLLLFYISETRRDKGLLVNEKQKHIFNMYPCYVSVFSRNLYKKPTASFLSGEGTKLTAKRSVAVVTKDIPECRPV